GRSFTVSKASDHVIHNGPLCIDGLGCNLSNPPRDRTLLDFFQVSIDPTNGAADVTFADDHAAPGTAVVYFTRQCTGTSATTGSALVNDCVAPAPSNGPVVTYSDGTFSGGNLNPTNAITGSFNPGPNGTIVFTVPRADVGSPANGATLTSPFADTRGSFTVMGTGVYYTSAADRAPDSGYGANYVVGQAC